MAMTVVDTISSLHMVLDEIVENMLPYGLHCSLHLVCNAKFLSEHDPNKGCKGDLELVSSVKPSNNYSNKISKYE